MFTTKASANEVDLLQSSSINNAEVSYRYGWGAALANIAGQALGSGGNGPTLSDLNGGKTKNFKPLTCGPYGKGGTPNSCR